jgi:hypothetical protein
MGVRLSPNRLRNPIRAFLELQRYSSRMVMGLLVMGLLVIGLLVIGLLEGRTTEGNTGQPAPNHNAFDLGNIHPGWDVVILVSIRAF